MSGPKSYHAEVFDQHLKSLFQLQGEVKLLWEEVLKVSKTSGKATANEGLHDFVAASEPKVKNAVMGFDRQAHGVLNQKQFDAFYNNIHPRIEQLKKLKKSLADQLAKTLEQEEAYRDYLEHEKLIRKLTVDFQLLKKQTLERVDRSRLPEPERQLKAKQISDMGFDVSMPPFNKAPVEGLEEQILQQFHEAREQLGRVFSDAGNDGTKADLRVSYSKEQPEKKAVMRKINVALLKVKNRAQKHEFINRLQKLQQPTKNKDDYYLKELHADILSEIKQQDLRGRLARVKLKFEASDFDRTLSGLTGVFWEGLNKALKKDFNRNDEVDALESRFHELTAQNRKARVAQAFEREEKAYIRSRLVSALRDLNYEVAAKTELIDFERDTDFLLHIPEQKNYLNLRFDEDGKVLYNFLIPEGKDSLGMDETAVKLSEMEETCKAFNDVLETLREQGLDIDLKHEIPVSEKALISIPGYQAEKIKNEQVISSKSKNHQKPQSKQKRL